MKIGSAARSNGSRLSERIMIISRMKLKLVGLSSMLVLAAALATSAVAEEVPPKPSGDAKTTGSAAHTPDLLPAGNGSAPAKGAANTEEIDTRITVQPHGPLSGKPGRVGNSANPIVPLKLINPHRRTFSPSRTANRLPSNTPSIPGAQHQNVQQNLGERLEYKGLTPRPVIAGTNGAVGLGQGNSLGRSPAVQSTAIAPLAGGAKTVIRGGIGGAGFNHRGVGTSAVGIGGPARTVTGINGTSIHETH
jgi:hypothetical protein